MKWKKAKEMDVIQAKGVCFGYKIRIVLDYKDFRYKIYKVYSDDSLKYLNSFYSMDAAVKEVERVEREETERNEAEKKAHADYTYLLDNKNAMIKKKIVEFLKCQNKR